MKVIKAFPPNYAEIDAALRPAKTFIFTYGDTVYFPMQGENGCMKELRQDLVVHEAIHYAQQSRFLMNPAKWWKRYLADPEWRFEQELEAYRKQWAFISENCNRKDRKALLDDMAKILSSRSYGNVCTYREAAELIQH